MTLRRWMWIFVGIGLASLALAAAGHWLLAWPDDAVGLWCGIGAGYLFLRAGDGPTSLLLPAAGSYELSGTIWNSGASIPVQCEPDAIDVGENGGTFQVTVRPK